mmetsp:Transcript_34758/g.70295  ORF Transcript_34758/g.70295 Transcript_34758/m.70295 type:complete len:357 (-) Transcript_34758:412-1482(-)
MGERKVLNKYIPADFDPRLVPRLKKSKDELIPVRMMLPFSIQCSSCSSFMYRGRKFNSKKEPVKGEKGKYLGIQRFRFYIKCTVCSRPVTFLTDPQNADYEMESGATRNYEVHKDKERADEDVAAERAAEEKEDPMKALENRVLASQREMQEMDSLEEIRALNMKHRQMMSGGAGGGGGVAASAGAAGGSGGDVSAILDSREAAKARAAAQEEELTETGLTESEEAMVKSIKFGASSSSGKSSIPSADGNPAAVIHRLDDDDEKELDERRKREEALLEQQQRALVEKTEAAAEAKSRMPMIKVKRKRKEQPVQSSRSTEESKKAKVEMNDNSDSDPAAAGGLGGLLGGYGSSDDSD